MGALFSWEILANQRGWLVRDPAVMPDQRGCAKNYTNNQPQRVCQQPFSINIGHPQPSLSTLNTTAILCKHYLSQQHGSFKFKVQETQGGLGRVH